MSFTPGPWAILPKDRVFPCEYDGMVIVTKVIGPEGDIAVIPDDYPTGAWANAQLIAAAPEMLEALEEALELLTYHYDGDGRYHSLDRPNGQTDTDCEFCRLAVQAETILARIKETPNA